MDLSLDSVPPPPREPSPRARELIFRYQASQGILLLCGGLFAAIGILLALPFCWNLPGDVIIAAAGREQRGRVLSRELDRSTKINGESPTLIRFTYSVDGQRYEAVSSTLDREVIRSAAPDSMIPIQVAGANPRWARMAGTTRSAFGYFGLLVLLFPAIGFLLIGFAVRSNRREIRAFVHGQPVLARVVKFGLDLSTRINRRHPFEVRWEFRVEERIYSGSLSSMSMLALEDLGKAQEIVVLYDQANPSINTAWVD